MIKKIILLNLLFFSSISPVIAQQLWDETVRVPFIRENLKSYYSCDVKNSYIVFDSNKKKYECIQDMGFWGKNENLGNIKKMSLDEIVKVHYNNEMCKNKKAVGFVPETTNGVHTPRKEDNTAWIMMAIRKIVWKNFQHNQATDLILM